ncbi:MAG: D-alanyl-D-alanine carboxypeptidase family protein [Anaerovoracaceae bacterium]|nr:D-alanyl-D-alanine carboxypeptidase [Bacillota bacterium]MEE0516811.1 D-alanyl-D-alanine carboxypeptidase family protein [Anaerovoracaceae bacterium]
MKKKYKIVFAVCLCMGALGWFSEFFGPSMHVDEEKVLKSKDYTRATGNDSDLSHGEVQPTDKARISPPVISAEGAILIDGNTGEALFEKNADKKLYPASTTKIMTAMVALEILDEIDADLGSTVSVPDDAVNTEGSSVYLKAGEKVTMEELFYGMMLQSGNDAALAVAICCGGTEEEFIKRMNMKAAEIGCSSTMFKNSSGLFDEGHFTTARDLAKISKTAMEKKEFREIVGSRDWRSEKTGRNFHNKNKTIFQYDDSTGVKIGYTKASGRTLVASAKRDGIELIAVVLNDSNWFEDAYAMLDYGFKKEKSGF